MALHIGTWHWGSKYDWRYVTSLESAVARNYHGAFSFHCWEPELEDRHLTQIPGCFCRLRTFDVAWQGRQGIEPGDRIVVLDLDLIVTGPLEAVCDREEPFVILQGVNSANPCPYNGSVWMLEAGYRPDVWGEFTYRAAQDVPWYAFPDDQAWFAAKLPGAGSFGPQEGVYAFEKPGWPKGPSLPQNARIVAFPGKRDPSQYQNLDWVRRHWR